MNQTSRRIAAYGTAGVVGLIVLGMAVSWPDPPTGGSGGVVAVLDTPAGRFETHGDDKLPPRPPGAPQAVPEVGWPCEGDGQDGKRVQWVYGWAGTDNTETRRPRIEQIAAQVEGIFATSSDGQRLVSYVTEPDCRLSILSFEFSDDARQSFDATINELAAAGLNHPERKYIVVSDFSAYCGIGTVSGDDQPGSANAANGGPSYSRVDSFCRNATTAAHELVHNFGGVQLSAPNTTGGWHCTDAHDVMCYADGGPTDAQRVECSDAANRERLDCLGNDYFSLAPSGYLAGHWNVASSQYLATGSPPTTEPPPPPPTTVPPPTTSTTVGQGDTKVDLSVQDGRLFSDTDVSFVAVVTGDCDPSGVVSFRVSGTEVSRTVVEDGVARATLRFSRGGRFTIRANYLGSEQCDTSTDSVRKRVTEA